jgi:hypothetical protein
VYSCYLAADWKYQHFVAFNDGKRKQCSFGGKRISL